MYIFKFLSRCNQEKNKKRKISFKSYRADMMCIGWLKIQTDGQTDGRIDIQTSSTKTICLPENAGGRDIIYQCPSIFRKITTGILNFHFHFHLSLHNYGVVRFDTHSSKGGICTHLLFDIKCLFWTLVVCNTQSIWF